MVLIIAMMDTIYRRRRRFNCAIWQCIRSADRSHDTPRPGPIWQARLHDRPFRFSVSHAIVFFSLTIEVENLLQKSTRRLTTFSNSRPNARRALARFAGGA